jgi:hypothetical protein
MDEEGNVYVPTPEGEVPEFAQVGDYILPVTTDENGNPYVAVEHLDMADGEEEYDDSDFDHGYDDDEDFDYDDAETERMETEGEY